MKTQEILLKKKDFRGILFKEHTYKKIESCFFFSLLLTL